MTDKCFDNLSREELLILVQQQQQQIDALRRALDERLLVLDEAGSIAQAAMELSGVFQASQTAADQYLQSVEALKSRQEEVCAQRLSQTESQCREMVAQAEEKAAYYWDALQKRVEEFLSSRSELLQPQQEGEADAPSEECFGPDD